MVGIAGIPIGIPLTGIPIGIPLTGIPLTGPGLLGTCIFGRGCTGCVVTGTVPCLLVVNPVIGVKFVTKSLICSGVKVCLSI